MSHIKINRARCKLCNTIAESTHQHHLCFCECGSIAVDGGTSYLRRCGNLEHLEELSIFSKPSEHGDIDGSK